MAKKNPLPKEDKKVDVDSTTVPKNASVNQNRETTEPNKDNEINLEGKECCKDECIFRFDIYDIVMLLLIVFHVILNPYTKVEETFITNNMYDHLIHGSNIRDECINNQCKSGIYDFIEFPGVVERSFIPSLIISIISYPFHYFMIEVSKMSVVASLYLTRITLGALVFLSIKYLKVTILKTMKCRITAESFSILFLVQFHPLFYSSRPLPNTFALALTNIAYACWMQRNWHLTITFLAVSSIIFRCDIVVFAFSLIIIDLYRFRIPLIKCFIWGSITSIICVALTILIDSHFWGFWLWPELQVLKFNTIMNKSSHWGVSPWYWYFVFAIPKSVTIAYPLALFAIIYKPKASYIDWGVVELLLPALSFVGLYSILPHKELRFIFPALTIFNLCGAIGIAKILKKLSGWKFINFILYIGLIIGLCISLISSGFLTYISYHNYPGGKAMREFNSEFLQLQKDINQTVALPTPYIHVDVYPAMTGVTRFLYENEKYGWRYNRTEYLSDQQKAVFTHLFTDYPKVEGFKIYKVYDTYSHIDFMQKKVAFKKGVYVHERNDIYEQRITTRSESGTKCADRNT